MPVFGMRRDLPIIIDRPLLDCRPTVRKESSHEVQRSKVLFFVPLSLLQPSLTLIIKVIVCVHACVDTDRPIVTQPAQKGL